MDLDPNARWALPLGVATGLWLLFWMAQLAADRWGAGAGILLASILSLAVAAWLPWQLPRLSGKLQARSQIGLDTMAAHYEHLASMLSGSMAAILSIDGEGTIQSWNRGAALLLGYRADEVRGMAISELMVGGRGAGLETRWLQAAAAKAGSIQGHETTLIAENGREVLVELIATPLDHRTGVPSGMSLVLRDITRQKRREQEIRGIYEGLNREVEDRTKQLAEKVDELALANLQLQKLDQMRSEFVSLVTHQIRAPLTNMSGAVSRMQGGCSVVNATCGRMFTVLHQQVERLDHLVGDVLSAARIEAGELLLEQEPISILPVIEQVLEQAGARLMERKVQLPTKPGLPLVFADRDRVAEILANFLDNADKYSAPGADIAIDLRADQTEVVVSVADRGPGLTEADLARVFEKFYRSDSSDSQAAYGYGLGLYVCRLLAEAQGGRVWAENHPEGGAAFSLALPVWQDDDERVLHPTYR